MSAVPTPPSIPPTVAATKFRAPRLRRDAIPRPRLLGRVVESARTLPLTVVAAPAGYGKTTLLAQAIGALDEGVAAAWISLDADDADAGRWYANLVRATQSFALTWAEDPAALVANAAAGGSPARAAIGAFVNALCTAAAPRLVIVLDDGHHADGAEIASLLEALVERLPEHVGLVLGTRRVPEALPLARWRVRGEAEEFGAADLAFDADEARALAGDRAGELAAAAAERALARAHGWPAGTALLLRAAPRATPAPGDASVPTHSPEAERALYDYLAAEVYAQLAPELREFALDCSVLDVLTPAACAAVSGCEDAPARLRGLYRLEGFVLALDAHGPVLRFHDLFRDFLRARLDAQSPERRSTLHARAAEAAEDAVQALGHWAAAGRREAFVARLLREADALLAVGGPASLERWLARVPGPDGDSAAELHHLRGLAAWRRWDWLRARAHFEHAVEAARAAGREPPPAMLLPLMGSLNGLGEREAAEALAARLADAPLGTGDRAAFALQQAWCAMGAGRPDLVVAAFAEFAALAARDPGRICARAAYRAHTAYVGLPGMLPLYDSFLRSCRAVEGEALAPWHAAPRLIEAWLHLWRGERAACEHALAEADAIQRRFGGIVPLEDAAARLHALYGALAGRDDARERGWALVRRFELPRAASLKVAFERAYVCGAARVAWLGEHLDDLRDCERRLRAPRGSREWAFIDLARRTLAGEVALLEGRHAAAEAEFAAALPLLPTLRFVQGHSDPRIGLACARLRQGRRDAAWEALAPAIDECLAEDVVGPLLCSPPPVRDEVVGLVPATHPERARLDGLLARLDDWRAAAAVPAAPRPAPSGPLALLTEREREVLARVALGEGNKEIARHLDLSLHTVKRHLANLLGKLDCVSRRQAADLYRRHSGF